MEEILQSRHYRRMFLLVMMLILLLVLGIRFFLLPYFDSTLQISSGALVASILDNLFSTLLVTAAVGGFVFWLTPKLVQGAKIEVVATHDIGNLLRSAAENADKWWFRGGLGRYTRSITLPLMAAAARRGNLRREISIEILDPDDRALCSRYANYRRGLSSASNEKTSWTEARVREELYATILCAYVTKGREPMLDVTVVLSRWYSSFRLDLSSPYVVVTREDKKNRQCVATQARTFTAHTMTM